jgi:hypothetical protein
MDAEDIEGNSGEFVDELLGLLGDIDKVAHRSISCSKDHVLHIYADGQIWFMALCEKAVGRRVAFAFLEELRGHFTQRFGGLQSDKLGTTKAFGLQELFEDDMRGVAEKFKGVQGRTAVLKASDVVKNMNNNMAEAIDAVGRSREKLQLTLTRSNTMQQGASSMRMNSMKLKRQIREKQMIKAREPPQWSIDWWRQQMMLQVCCGRGGQQNQRPVVGVPVRSRSSSPASPSASGGA